MFRSLHMKLVMIMLLLVTSLMAVVGAFLMTSVTNFYIDDFYEQMSEVFGESNATFVSSLREEAAQEDGAVRLQTMLEAYSGTLSIDSRNRNYYVLDGRSGEVLASSNEDGQLLEQTENILTARNGEVGDHSDLAASYMDVAIPISGGDNSFIIYIRDSHTTVSSLNSELLFIILQALLVGLLVSVLLSFLLAKTMIDPIEKLTEGAERIATGDFDETLAVESTDEIGVLTTTFNDMASVLHSTLEAVENERNKLDTLFLHMSDGVVAYDGSGKLIHCNPAACELLGRTADECVYSELFESICPFSHVITMQRSDYVEGELTVGERSVELYFAPFSDEESGGVLIVLHDVTEHRKTEERRKEFVANVSHELRTPLTNVRSYAETIREAGDDLSRETENDFLDVVISETDRMTHIVQDLLTLSRLDSGRSEMNMARSPCSARRSLRPAATSTSSRTTIPKISRSSWAIAAASSRSCSTSSAMPSSTRPTAATSVSPRAARAKLSGWRSRTTASAFPRPTAAAFSSASTASTKQDRANPAAQASAFPSRRRSSSVTTARSRSLTAPAPARPSA